MKRFTSKTQKIGELGETIATKFLIDKGFSVVERNYTKKVGEIDIVAQQDGIIHFIEVKTIVSYETKLNVSRETFEKYSPFENLSTFKMKKFARTCQWYLLEKRVARETPWVMDAIAVSVNEKTRSAKLDVLWNIIL
jgi:putative endonuclease